MKKQHLFIGGKLTESVDYKELQAPYSGKRWQKSLRLQPRKRRLLL